MVTEDIQTRKLISAYGGIGSIIESRQGALQILPFDQWPFARKMGQYGKECDKPAYRIDDERLVARLRSHFVNLTKLVRLPAKDGDNRFGGGLPGKQAAARYFPRWMYCSSCNRFNDYAEWLAKWTNTVPTAERSQFSPPRCGWCYAAAPVKNKFHPLEQVRFMMTSPGGHIADVPWPQWALRNLRPVAPDGPDALAEGPDDDLDQGKGTRLDLRTPLPPGLTLRYRTAAKFGDLKGIIISAVDAEGKEIGSSTLAGIFGLRVPEAALVNFGRGNVLMKAVLRSSTSVYYPNIMHSLYLPTAPTAATGITVEILADLKEMYEDGTPSKGLLKFLQKAYDLVVSGEYLQSLIDSNFHLPPPEATSPDEAAYRQAEYNFLTQQPEGRYHTTELVLEPVAPGPVPVAGIAALLRLEKLKLTSVQTSYTRQQPIERDTFLAADEADAQAVQRCYTTKFKNTTYLLPAVESYGEGLFIELDAATLAQWENRPDVRAHANQIRQNLLRLPTANISPRPSLERFILLHTLSHLLIKELEFQCGYPATSLQERLYVGPVMQGILIYTIAGSEGSYGGLVSVGRRGELSGLLRSALNRARYDCAADPICWQTGPEGQGPGGLNLAACASCTLLPETSCEEFSSLLDRKLVVDPAFGYFAEIIAAER
jgi:hypothetical protein